MHSTSSCYAKDMYIHVKLLNGFKEPLWYKAPPDHTCDTLIGAIVHVPLRARIVPAYVMTHTDALPADITFSIRPAHSVEPFPADPFYWKFVHTIAEYYCTETLYFVKRIKQFIESEKPTCDAPATYSHDTNHIHSSIKLTNEQQHAYDSIKPFIDSPTYMPTVLHGVTGSGKTEIYKKLILDTIEQGKTTLLLLPEVTLAASFEQRIKKELGATIPIYSFHSATSITEKRALWQCLVHKSPLLIIGVHLPILLPIANLGLIIIDEEHETGYQEKKHPKINTKYVALWRASLYNIPIILGSATPSIPTLHKVKTKKWKFLQLKNRYSGAFPRIHTVYLSDKKQRKNFWISTELYMAIKNRLEKKEQTLLFLNRRGHSFFVQCKACSFIFTCSNCSVSLTLHEGNILRCHYCEHKHYLPATCPGCTAPEQEFIKKGIGTQQIVSIIEKLFPHARVARADLDATVKRKKWQDTMQTFALGDIDILVGTQTITKGYDFPNVTLVGIIWADLHLNFPSFNASEITLQQLIQVAGRAGRHQTHSDVIVQAMGHHTIFNFLHEIDYLQFYAYSMATRIELGYPPAKRLALIELKHTNETIIEKEAYAIAYHLQTKRTMKNCDVQILGPAQPPVHKIEKTFIRHIYLKAQSIDDIYVLYNAITHTKYKSKIYFTPNAE